MQIADVSRIAIAGLMYAAALGTTPALAQSSGNADVSEANKRKVAAMFDSWRAGTGGAADILSDDIRWTIAGNSLAAGTSVGKQQLMKDVLGPFGARFAKSSDKFKPTELRGLYAESEYVIALWDGAGTSNDGKPYVNSYAWFLKMRDGMVVEATAFFDSIAFNDLWTRVPAGQ